MHCRYGNLHYRKAVVKCKKVDGKGREQLFHWEMAASQKVHK